MAFTKKRIDVSFTLFPNVDLNGAVTTPNYFDSTGGNTVELTGYRVSASIIKAGGIASQGQLQLRIYGMSLSLMNQLSTLGKTPIQVARNIITVSAGDDNGVSLVFKGTIYSAVQDFSAAPEVAFDVTASSLLYQAVQTIPPTSYKGTVDAALILQGLATQMGMSFENNGVSVIWENVYFPGSALTQAKDVIAAADIEWNQGDNGVLAIWPKGGYRNLPVPLLSASTGMIGYPYPSGNGLLGVRSIFNPQINFGARVQVDSIIKPAVGLWFVTSLAHDLESEIPNGAWFTSIVATPPGYGLLPT